MKRNKKIQNIRNSPELPQSKQRSFSSTNRSPISIFSFWLAIFDGLFHYNSTLEVSILYYFTFKTLALSASFSQEKNICLFTSLHSRRILFSVPSKCCIEDTVETGCEIYAAINGYVGEIEHWSDVISCCSLLKSFEFNWTYWKPCLMVMPTYRVNQYWFKLPSTIPQIFQIFKYPEPIKCFVFQRETTTKIIVKTRVRFQWRFSCCTEKGRSECVSRGNEKLSLLGCNG
jgi:hypothetical protein